MGALLLRGVVHLIGKVVEQGAGHALLLLVDELGGKARGARRQLDDLLVIELVVQAIGQQAANDAAAAAVLPPNGNDIAPPGSGLGGVLLLRGKQQTGEEGEQPPKSPGQKAHQQGGYQGALPHAGQTTGQNQGGGHGNGGHGHVKADLGDAEVGVPGEHHRPHKGLAGQHGHVSQYLQIDAEGQHCAARQQIKDLFGIGAGGDKE